MHRLTRVEMAKADNWRPMGGRASAARWAPVEGWVDRAGAARTASLVAVGSAVAAAVALEGLEDLAEEPWPAQVEPLRPGVLQDTPAERFPCASTMPSSTCWFRPPASLTTKDALSTSTSPRRADRCWAPQALWFRAACSLRAFLTATNQIPRRRCCGTWTPMAMVAACQAMVIMSD